MLELYYCSTSYIFLNKYSIKSHWCLELHSLIVGKEANEISTLQLPSYARLSPNPTLKQP